MPPTGDKTQDERGIVQALLGDGRFLLALTGVALIFSGGFAVAVVPSSNPEHPSAYKAYNFNPDRRVRSAARSCLLDSLKKRLDAPAAGRQHRVSCDLSGQANDGPACTLHSKSIRQGQCRRS